MNKFRFYFLLILSVIIFSCNKSDSSDPVPPRDFAEQYAEDIATIEDFLNTHYIDVVNSTGVDDQDVTFTKIPSGGTQPSMMSWLNREAYPKLLVKEVELDDITYKVYYIKLREDNATGEAPTRVDRVKVAYKGSYLYYETSTNLITKQFDYNPYPDDFFSLTAVIRGWTEIIPMFKAGVFVEPTTPGEPSKFTDFGAGVMFVPSGLGYYNLAQENIPSYSCLVFNFKLYDVARADHDNDGVLSIYEDINGNGIFTDDDTDGDGIYDYLDSDDDEDGYFTKTEIKNPETGAAYPFDQIPTCPSGKKNYLDIDCHP